MKLTICLVSDFALLDKSAWQQEQEQFYNLVFERILYLNIPAK